MTTERHLIYVPVLHSLGDMGSLASQLSPSSDYGVLVGKYWDRIEAELRGLGQAWRDVRVYQDGLPDTSAAIVARVVAEVDSPNYRLLRWLAEQGAVVVGTEDPVLLQEEYELLKASVGDEKARCAYAARADGLLDERDQYIAARIDATLPAGGTGILFIGLQHDVKGALVPGFAITGLRSSSELVAAVPHLHRRPRGVR